MKGSILFLTSVPSFYKNILFNRLAETQSVKVFFTNRSNIDREGDFYRYANPSLCINKTKAGILSNIMAICRAAKACDRIYYGGWNDIFYWLFIFILPKGKNYVMVESSVNEYSNLSYKNKVLNKAKKVFLKRAVACVVSGQAQADLINKLDFSGTVIKSLSVGLLDFDYPPILKNPLEEPITDFLFIGRLSKQKGTDLLIAAFKQMPQYRLHLIGQVEEEIILETDVNIIYHGYRKRNELRPFFQTCNVFILPSMIEPWGLVVEEALYHGLPVIVSDKVGCKEELVLRYDTGLVFNAKEPGALIKAVLEVAQPKIYGQLVKNIASIDFEKRSIHYVNSFMNNCLG